MTIIITQNLKEIKMKVKFTKASQTGHQVTLRVKQIPAHRELFFKKGKRFIVTIEGAETVFTVNREDQTMVTKAFPRYCKLPSVGRPVSYNATLIEEV